MPFSSSSFQRLCSAGESQHFQAGRVCHTHPTAPAPALLAARRFYRKRLARRLLQDKSASDDHERSILTRLKQQCGAQVRSGRWGWGLGGGKQQCGAQLRAGR